METFTSFNPDLDVPSVQNCVDYFKEEQLQLIELEHF